MNPRTLGDWLATRWRYATMAVLLGLTVSLGVPYCGRWWRIDMCLDSGGAWNEERSTCEH
ncbi:hypothetical protein HUA75_05315 [Myxococcus sp. CA040A]|nr:hypothetical protein [Myxococcus sp. CA040A]